MYRSVCRIASRLLTICFYLLSVSLNAVEPPAKSASENMSDVGLRDYQIVRVLIAEKRIVLRQAQNEFLILHEGDLFPKNDFRVLRFTKKQVILEKINGITKSAISGGIQDLVIVEERDGQIHARSISAKPRTSVPLSSNTVSVPANQKQQAKKDKH